jgi:hypothetical protein
MAMKRPVVPTMVLVVLTLAGTSAAEEKAKPDGTFTWKYKNQSAVHTLKLKLEGEKLTGTLKNFQDDREWPIEDAAYKDGVVSFKHSYKGRGGPQLVSSYTGTVSKDGIKGKIDIKHPDHTRSIDWDAKRVEKLP